MKDTEDCWFYFCYVFKIIFSDDPKLIISPNFPGNYPKNIDQCWVATPRLGYAVSLEFLSFHVSLNVHMIIKIVSNKADRYPSNIVT